MTVVVVTHSEHDAAVDAVLDAVRARGERAVRFDGDHYPTRASLTFELSDDAPAGGAIADDALDEGGPVALEDVRAIWLYQTWAGYRLPAGPYRALGQELAAAAMQGTLEASGAFVMDPPGPAERKPVQLRAARAVGLAIPRTMVSNDPASVRRFAEVVRARGGEVVTKSPGTWLKQFEDDGTLTAKAYTSVVTDEALDALEGLRLGPMMFQERIPKRRELRVVVVGHDVFAVAIDPSESPDGEVDWRRSHAHDYTRTPYALPAEIHARVLALMDLLGVNYAALDLIVTPEGRHVFLEANPSCGGFEQLHEAGLPVVDAIADVLVGRRRRRAPARTQLWAPADT